MEKIHVLALLVAILIFLIVMLFLNNYFISKQQEKMLSPINFEHEYPCQNWNAYNLG